jgi:hypothetical protein
MILSNSLPFVARPCDQGTMMEFMGTFSAPTHSVVVEDDKHLDFGLKRGCWCRDQTDELMARVTPVLFR